MPAKIYREYRLKFYLNARHYIATNGNIGAVHPHTWEFTLTIRIGRSSFTPFSAFEKRITAILAPYQDKLLNEVAPFTSILPIVENMVDYFSEEFYRAIDEIDGTLIQIEASETPTRTYILNLAAHPEEKREDKAMLTSLVGSVLDDILH